MLKINAWVYAGIALFALAAIVILAVFAGPVFGAAAGVVTTITMAVLSAANGQAKGVQRDTPVDPPRIPPLPLLVLALVLPVALGPLYACSAAKDQQVVHDVSPVASCITSALMSGTVDPLAIVASCAGATVQAVIAVIEDLLRQPTMGVERAAQLQSVRARALELHAAGHP